MCSTPANRGNQSETTAHGTRTDTCVMSPQSVSISLVPARAASSTTWPDDLGCAVISSQLGPLSDEDRRPERRSDGGQMILHASSGYSRPWPDLGFRVELRGFEPLTPSMPWRCATSCATAPREPDPTGLRRPASV